LVDERREKYKERGKERRKGKVDENKILKSNQLWYSQTMIGKSPKNDTS